MSVNSNWNEIWAELGTSMSKNPARAMRYAAIESHLNDGSILDFGAGDGHLVRLMQSKNRDAWGLEISNEGVLKAEELATQIKLPKRVFKFAESSLIPQEFSNVVISEVLEHIEHPITFLIDIKKFMTSRSILIVTVPAGPISYFDRFIGHFRHYTTASLRSTLESAGYDVVKLRKLGFPLITLVRLWALIRGEKAVQDLREGKVGSKSVLFLLGLLIKPSLFPSVFGGWQLIAVARIRD